MEFWQLIVALIQGLVEWLPISSEGQAVLFVFNIGAVPLESVITLAVWLHMGTAIAVIVRYPRTIMEILSLQDRQLFRHLLISTICTAITAMPLYFLLKNAISIFQGEILNILIGFLLLATALLLYLPSRTNSKATKPETIEPSDRIAAMTGLAQGFSVLPGLSRSGITISALLLQKVDKEKALRFSFLMSVPAVFGIFAVEYITGGAALPTIAPLDLLGMEIVVFVVGLTSMEGLLRLAQSVSFWKLCLFLGSLAVIFGIPALL
ncbi:undecaprenyl-diphosphate phosphatase [Candidatus Thorarchaeota archaeon]|nr:MAG: undecaprenyl-diphosphate phosphatase [Candidatus Thorarchaeota archaeon]